MKVTSTGGLHLVFILALCATQSSSLEEKGVFAGGRSDTPRVYVDCGGCDMDFIRTEITFVDYVRDGLEAQVHILVTTEWTASGGTEYTITFIGQKEFDGMEDTLKYISRSSDTDDDTRRGIVQTLKMGLVRFASRTRVAQDISISYKKKSEPTAVKDLWDDWVFSVSMNGSADGEKSYDDVYFWTSVSAKKVTPELKVRLSLYGNYEEDRLDIGEERISSISRYLSGSGTVVKSLGEHWSLGGKFNGYSSTYSNLSLSVSAGPALEYNFFPYSDCTRRELRFLYRLAAQDVHYFDETIYDEFYEHLFFQSLTTTLELKYAWGSTYSELYGSNYLHDFRKNRLSFYNNLSVRIVEGLSFNMYGSVEMIHDQLSIAKGDASAEDIYLHRTELETQYSYWASIGFSYTFGSIYSNVVNPRFGE